MLCLSLSHDSLISSSFTLHFSKCLCFRRLVFYLLFLKRKKIWKSLELLTERKSQWTILLHRHIVSRHRVDGVLSFLSSRPNWIGTLPTPSHAGECVPPTLFGSGGSTLACGGGNGVSQFQRGDRHSICTLCLEDKHIMTALKSSSFGFFLELSEACCFF